MSAHEPSPAAIPLWEQGWQHVAEAWQWLGDNDAQIGTVLALAVALYGLYKWLSRKTAPFPVGDAGDATVKLIEEARLTGNLSAQLADSRASEQGALEQLEEATQALAALSKTAGAPAGTDEALALLAEGKSEAAESIFQEVLERREAEGVDALKEAAAAARHIGALAFFHDTEKSLAAYSKAVKLDQDDSDGWNQLGHLFSRTGDLDAATDAYKRILSLGRAANDQLIIAIATGNLGILYMTRGDLDHAEEMLSESLEIGEALDSKEVMANSYSNLGHVHQTRGDLDRAEEMHRKSLEINNVLGHEVAVALQYGNLGLVYMTRGDLDRAEEMFRKSLEIDETIGHKEGIANAYGNLGVLYHTLGNIDRAEEMYREALGIEEVLGRKEGIANAYGNLGLVYQVRGDPDRAEEMFRKSLEIDEALGRKEGVANQCTNLGVLYGACGDLDRAEKMFRKSLGLFREIGASPMVQRVEGLLKKLRE